MRPAERRLTARRRCGGASGCRMGIGNGRCTGCVRCAAGRRRTLRPWANRTRGTATGTGRHRGMAPDPVGGRPGETGGDGGEGDAVLDVPAGGPVGVPVVCLARAGAGLAGGAAGHHPAAVGRPRLRDLHHGELPGGGVPPVPSGPAPPQGPPKAAAPECPSAGRFRALVSRIGGRCNLRRPPAKSRRRPVRGFSRFPALGSWNQCISASHSSPPQSSKPIPLRCHHSEGLPPNCSDSPSTVSRRNGFTPPFPANTFPGFNLFFPVRPRCSLSGYYHRHFQQDNMSDWYGGYR